MSNSSCTKSQAAEFWYLSFEYIEKKGKHHISIVLGQLSFPKCAIANTKRSLNSCTSRTCRMLELDRRFRTFLRLCREHGGLGCLEKRRIFFKFSDVSTPILASKPAVFKTFVSYFSKLNFRRHLIEFSNFLKFSPIKLGRRSGSFSIATAPTK